MKFFLTVVILALLYQASSQTNIRERIFNGQEVSIKEVPYQAFLVAKVNCKWSGAIFSLFCDKLSCGASIISEYHLLTAAHCVWGAEKVKIYVGNKIQLRGVSYKAKSWISHPDYSLCAMEKNDIAIVTLKNKMKFSDTIKPIRLPSLAEENLNLDNKRALISGWGTTESLSGSKTLRAANITISKCEAEPKLPGNLEICIVKGQDEITPCHGDSGGPLMVDNKLFGVASSVNHSIACVDCSNSQFFKYTNVAKYLHWIGKITGIKIQA